MSLQENPQTGIWVVIPAAGSGSRMGTKTPKQYLDLRGRPVLAHTLNALCAHPRIQAVQMVLAADDQNWANMPSWVSPWADKLLAPVVGGASRAMSVLNGVKRIALHAHANDWVMVHDAARPCLRRADLDALIAALESEEVGAILGVPVADTLKQVGAGLITHTVSREQLWRAFTPQVFRLGALERALMLALAQGVEITDEASALEWQGLQPRMVRGHTDNIKITLAEDLALASQILAAMAEEESQCG